MAKVLVTGGAGFIGSHLVRQLLDQGNQVAVLDNYLTGFSSNLDAIRDDIEFLEGDIRSFEICQQAVKGTSVIYHQAALGSVPRSTKDPITSHEINVTGFINMLKAAVDEGTQRFVFASSSSVYGDSPKLPKVEEEIGKPLSPYAATKLMNEVYADVFAKNYAIEVIGLRYFNVFGPRQTPDGPYAAVIPRWVQTILKNEAISIFGDGKTSRDFCYIKNVVQANILAGTTTNKDALNTFYNVACHDQTDLNILATTLREEIAKLTQQPLAPEPVYEDFRPGDIRHSFAEINKACDLLGYQPTHTLQEGLAEALPWYIENLGITR